jgi:hypothetical protein
MFRNWKPDDLMKLILSVSVAYFICTYVTGMFVQNQPTNADNKDLRLAIVILMTTIVNGIINSKNFI